MTRIKELPIGSTNLPEYKSPPSRIIRSLRAAYDNLREKLAEKSEIIQSLQGKLRDIQESRSVWKIRSKDAEAKIIELEQENRNLQNELKKNARNNRKQ